MAAGLIGQGTTQAITEDFGGIAREGMQDIIAQQDKVKAEELAKTKRNEEWDDKYGTNEDDYFIEGSGFRTADDTALEAVSLMRDRRWEVLEKFKADPNNMQYKRQLANIDANVKRLKATNEKFGGMYTKYMDMLEKDELSALDEDKWQDRFERYENGEIKTTADKDNNLVYNFYKKGEDGKLVREDVQSYNEFIKEDFIRKVNIDDELDTMVERIGRTALDEVSGGFINSSDTWGASQEKFANDTIDAFLGTDEKSLKNNDTLADIINQQTGGSSMQRDNFTEAQRQGAKTALMNRLKGMYDEKSVKKKLPNPPAQTAAEAKKVDRTNISLATDGTGAPIMKGDSVGFTLNKPIQIGAADKNAMIDGIYMNPDNNAISYSGQQRRKIEWENLSTQDKEDFKKAGFEGDFETKDKTEKEKNIAELKAIFADTPRLQTETVFTELTGEDAMILDKIAVRHQMNGGQELTQYLKSILPQGGASKSVTTESGTVYQ